MTDLRIGRALDCIAQTKSILAFLMDFTLNVAPRQPVEISEDGITGLFTILAHADDRLTEADRNISEEATSGQ